MIVSSLAATTAQLPDCPSGGGQTPDAYTITIMFDFQYDLPFVKCCLPD